MRAKILYDIAERDGITIDNFAMQSMKSQSHLLDGECYIALDYARFADEADELIHLAHELGHCEKGAFYNRYSKLDLKSRHERRAWTWAIKQLLPVDSLHQTIHEGNSEPWQLAEYFDYPQWFVEMALDYYRGQGVMTSF